MFLHADIKGNDLPARTLCLTYDDGPGESCGDGAGPRTEALGEFLSSEGIRAIFFVIGAHAERHPHVLRSLARRDPPAWVFLHGLKSPLSSTALRAARGRGPSHKSAVESGETRNVAAAAGASGDVLRASPDRPGT